MAILPDLGAQESFQSLICLCSGKPCISDLGQQVCAKLLLQLTADSYCDISRAPYQQRLAAIPPARYSQ